MNTAALHDAIHAGAVTAIHRAIAEAHQQHRPKVQTIDAISYISQWYPAKRIVQAHGAFDLLHLGHIRHLQAAKRLGDILVVTVTPDRFVNKGPNRPVFAEALRAEALAALDCVDFVAINDAPDAVSAIEQIRPDIYVKGQDYQNPQGDVTGKIAREREAVEAHGGKLVFTDEVTYSSSELINRHFNVHEPEVKDHLDSLRPALPDILALIDSVKDYRVLLVGDAIIDEYQYVLPMGKPPKESIIAARYQDTETFAGGVFAAANHLASFVKEVDVVTCLGADDSNEDFIRGRLATNVELTSLLRRGAPTTVKRRFVDPSSMRKLFEVYEMDDEPLSEAVRCHLEMIVGAEVDGYDLVVVTDFGHGLIGPRIIKMLGDGCKRLAVNTQSNSANLGYNLITRYPWATYACLDEPEARLARHDRSSPITEIMRSLPYPFAIVTRGQHGCVTWDGDTTHTLPALAKNVTDTVGAGDAFFAITAPLVAAGGPMHHVGFIGNVTGAIKVGIVGNRTAVDKAALVKSITGLLK